MWLVGHTTDVPNPRHSTPQELEAKNNEGESNREKLRASIAGLEERRKEILAEMERSMSGYAQLEENTKLMEVEREDLKKEVAVGEDYAHL